VVKDDEGQPVEGAAVDLSGEMAFTNSRGEFFVRVRRPQRYALTIPLDEFLLPGRWEVVAAPAEAIAESEEQARPVEIILRRDRQASAAPEPVPAPPAAPAPQSAPADTSVWQTADTLHRVSRAAARAAQPRLAISFSKERVELDDDSRPWSPWKPERSGCLEQCSEQERGVSA
jgi:hypothetical protein